MKYGENLHREAEFPSIHIAITEEPDTKVGKSSMENRLFNHDMYPEKVDNR